MEKYSEEFMQYCKDKILEGQSIASLSKELGVDRHVLSRKLKLLGVESNKSNGGSRECYNKYDDINLLTEYYNEMIELGMSLSEYEKYKHIWRSYFANALKDKLGIEINQCNRKSLNENVFDDINNEQSAYWLGFLMADGYNSKDYKKLELSLKDKDHVEKFKNFLGSDHKICKRIVKSNNAIIYRISIGSKYMCNRLKDLGIVNNKTYKDIYITPELDSSNIKHFLRGLFDGDGYIGVKKNVNGKKYITKIELASYSESNLKVIEDLIYKETNIKMKIKHYDSNHCPILTITGKNARLLCNYLYKDSNIYLTRKYMLNENYNIAV